MQVRVLSPPPFLFITAKPSHFPSRTLNCDDQVLMKPRALPLSYGPTCWSHRDSNPEPRHSSDVVPSAFVANQKMCFVLSALYLPFKSKYQDQSTKHGFRKKGDKN